MKKTFLISLVLFLLQIAAPLAEASRVDTVGRAWEEYISSQKKLQVAVHHLLRLHHPDLRKTIDVSQEYQLGLAKMREYRFYHLLERFPERIERDQGFEAFVNFPWKVEDENRLLASNQEFKKLAKAVLKNKAKLDKDSKYEDIQVALFELQKEREYREILARFRFVSKEVEYLLNGGERLEDHYQSFE